MRKTKILIVEDDVLIAMDIEKTLQEHGYATATVITTGKQEVSKIVKQNPDLILMDIMFHGEVRGIDIARKVRESLDVPVVYLTAHSDEDILTQAKVTEPYGYLIKPVSERELLITLEQAISKHRMEKKFKERMEKALQESENRYRHLVESINEGIVTQDRRGHITYANRRFLEMLGYKEEDVIGKPITKFLAGGLLKKEDPQAAKKDDDARDVTEVSWIRKDGERIFTILSPTPVYNHVGKHKETVAVLTDITDRREIEKELHRSREQLRLLSQHLQAVREEESKRIAREIHDELGQQLTALKMDLSWIMSKVDPDDEDAVPFLKKLESMSSLVDKTIQTVQKISAELRPGLLDDLGLVPAIEWLAQEFENQSKISCRLKLFCELLDLNPDCSTAIFRISQEALTNVVRHARASRVQISLTEQDSALVLKIEDNGVGIEPDEVFAPSSLGIMGMRERLRPFGGELTIAGKPKKGTILTVNLPISRVTKK